VVKEIGIKDSRCECRFLYYIFFLRRLFDVERAKIICVPCGTYSKFNNILFQKFMTNKNIFIVLNFILLSRRCIA
jgi:hypothetical protein